MSLREAAAAPWWSALSPRTHRPVAVPPRSVPRRTCCWFAMQGSLLLKAPQAAKIVAAGSATGLDPDSMYLDVLTFLITATTNFAHG